MSHPPATESTDKYSGSACPSATNFYNTTLRESMLQDHCPNPLSVPENFFQIKNGNKLKL